MQRVSGALADQAAKERRGATAIGPFRAGRVCDRAIEDEAKTVRCRFHRILAIARVAIRYREFIPFEPEGHAQHMMNCQPIAAWLVCEVNMFGELVVKLCLGGRHLAGRERNTIDQAHDALGNRAQIVRHVGAKGDGAERVSQASSSPCP